MFVHVRSRNNYHHLTFSHENRKNNSLLKSLFLFGVFNENKKITLISFINQNISEKYYQSKVLPLSKVPLFTNIPDFY